MCVGVCLILINASKHCRQCLNHTHVFHILHFIPKQVNNLISSGNVGTFPVLLVQLVGIYGWHVCGQGKQTSVMMSAILNAFSTVMPVTDGCFCTKQKESALVTLSIDY